MVCRSLSILLLTLSVLACGQVRPLPSEWNPADYTPIELEHLRRPAPGLQAGQLVKFHGYFWEFLNYDPVPQHYYLNQLRYPIRWQDLEWFALYEKAALQGYFDRAAMTFKQRSEFHPKRLDPLILYGELVPLGGGRLYFQTHHLEQVTVD